MTISYRIGVMPGPWPEQAETADFLWALIDLCEQTEIDSLWFSERLSAPTPVPEPITTLAAVAARTRRLKFGPSVLTSIQSRLDKQESIRGCQYTAGDYAAHLLRQRWLDRL